MTDVLQYGQMIYMPNILTQQPKANVKMTQPPEHLPADWIRTKGGKVRPVGSRRHKHLLRCIRRVSVIFIKAGRDDRFWIPFVREQKRFWE